MKKSKKETALKRRWIAFKTWLIENETNQSELASQLGIGVSTISMMIERGKFTNGVFAEWWNMNIAKKEAEA